MNRLSAAVLLSCVFVAVLLMGSSPAAYSDLNPTPEIIIVAMPIVWGGFYPGDMNAVPASSAVVFAEIEAGACCDLLEDRLRVSISACSPPGGGDFNLTHEGVEYVDDPVINGQSYRPGIMVDISDAGCSLPINGTPIDVKVIAESRAPNGVTSIGAIEWTFFSTGSSSSPPPPAATEDPEFELTAVNPTPLVPGQTRLISGKGLTSNTRVVFNTGELENTSFNSTTQRITFLVPEGIYCGEHTVQLRNPGGSREYSNIRTYTITQNCVDTDPDDSPDLIILPPPTFGDEDPGLAIDSLFPESGSPGTVVIINGAGFLDAKSYVLFDGEIMQTGEYLSDEQMRFTIPPGTPCQKLPVQIRNDLLVDEFSNDVDFAVIQPCGSQSGSGDPPGEDPPNDDPPNEDPPPPNNPPTPPPGGGEDIEDYDSNGDCRIDNNEFFGAVDLWISGSIDNGVFFAVLDAWISESDICGANASTTTLLEIDLLQRASGQVIFELQSDSNITMQHVEIYDLKGERIYTNHTMGRVLTWNKQLMDGNAVANGVYFYRVEAVSVDGQRLSSALRKLVVLN